MSVRVNSESFDTEVLNSAPAVLADFYSDSCLPCKRMSPVLAELEEEYADSLKVVKVNVNFDSGLAERYGVLSAPTLIFFHNGTEKARLSGAASKSDITEIIKNLK